MVDQSAAIELAKLKLTGMEHNVLLYLQGLSDYDNVVSQVSQVFLAEELTTTEATVSVCLKRLAELGLVQKQRLRGCTVFTINPKISARGRLK